MPLGLQPLQPLVEHHAVAIRVTKQLRKPNTTFAMFEKADEQTKLMEAQ